MMGQEQTSAPAMTPEQAADFAALQAGAVEQETEAAAMATEPAGPDLAGEITGLVLAFVAIAKPILPSLEGIYTPEVTAAAAGAVATVCNKHGWLSGGMMGEWGEEVAAAIVIVPLAIATAKAVRTDIDENNRKAEYIKLRKQADLVQHMNIAHNLDGKTEPVGDAPKWGQLTPQPAELEGVPA